MSRNEIVVDAPPRAVYEVLGDPERYPEWVVGAKRIRSVEGLWPHRGAKFHHTVGSGPLSVSDDTEVMDSEQDRRLVLSARARPAGIARVELVLEPLDGDRTRVLMYENPIGGPARLVPRFLMDPMTKARNAESLRRLKRLAERRDG